MIEEEKRHITKECCVEFLVQWIHNKGTEATVGKLKEALERIKLKDVAENLISGKREIPKFLFLNEYHVSCKRIAGQFLAN